MPRLSITLPLVVVAAAAAALVALPVAAGGAAHAALSEPGMIAVADRANMSVAVFHSNGTFAFYLEPSFDGGEDRRFFPEGVAIAPDGRIYVADHATSSILVFHSNGTFAFPIGSPGYGLGKFHRDPSGVAVGPDGRVVVVDDGHGRAQVFWPDGTFALDLGLGTGPPGPSGVAVGPDGRVYVAIRNSLGVGGIVHVFHQNGTLAFDLGPDGVAGGTFSALGVAVGPDGRVYVLAADSSDEYVGVHVFYPNGTLAFMVSDGVWCSDRYYPGYGYNSGSDGYIAVGSDGRIVVACHSHNILDDVNHTIRVLQPDGTFAFTFGSIPVRQQGEISSPADVAIGPDGRVYVADTGLSNIRVFHPNGTFAFPIGSRGGGDGQFDSWPCDVAVGPDGRVYVADGGPVQVFHPNGTFAFPIGPPGRGGGHFTEPCGVAVGPDGRVYVVDGGRVHVFQPDGPSAFTFDFALGDAFVSGGWLFDWPDIDLGPDGLIYLSGVREGAMAFYPNGTRAPFTDPDPRYGVGGVAVGPDGRVYVAGGGFSIVRVLYPNGTLDFSFGSHGEGNGQFRTPSGVAVGPDGRVYVADSDNGRVQVFHPNGTFALAMGEDWVVPGVVKSITGVAVGPGLPPSLPPAPPAPVTVVIEPGAAAAGPLDFTGAGHAANLTIDVAGLAGLGGPPLDGSASSVVTFPPAETSVAASFATVTFPPSVGATHVPADGRLALRVTADVPDDVRVQGALAYEGSGRVTLQRVVEVGDESGRVAFDMPVRILLEGQAGGRAFYIEGGADDTITPIDQACAADDTGRVHRHLGGAGECQTDSADGDKIIYTYHFTKFGTALPERGAMPPTVDTCSVSLGMPALGVSVRPGGYSEAVRQVIVNSGSAPFEGVGLAATPWVAGQGGGPAPAAAPPAPVVGTDTARTSHVLTATLVESLPASVTEVSTAGAGGAYVPLAAGLSVGDGLGGGVELPLWFRLNLTSYDVRAAELAQNVTYQATCRMPAPP